MKSHISSQLNAWMLSLLFLTAAYIYGILAPTHTMMSGNDYNVGLLVSAVGGFGIALGLRAVQFKKFGFSTLTWLSLALVILIQPIIHHIFYADGLIFPIGALLLAVLMSIFAVNLPEEKRPALIRGIAWLVLIVGILSVCTQIVQYFNPAGIRGIVIFMPPGNRVTGNLSQPNIASFVSVLAIVSAYYLFFLCKNNKKISSLLIFAIPLLTLGISLSSSRAGIVFLFVGLIGGLFYAWSSHKIRFLIFIGIALLSVIGYQAGVMLLQTWEVAQSASGVDRLVSSGVNLRAFLWERAWWAFGSNPIFGVGYNNYLSFGFDNIEKLGWFEPADHAHNLIAQIAAELGVLGLLTISGVVVVIVQKLFAFFTKTLNDDDLFVCLLSAIIVLYSMLEFPLWYPNFLLLFAFLIGLLDKGIVLKKPLPNNAISVFACIVAVCASIYTGLYYKYLYHYEMVMYADVDNQQKIDSYKAFPSTFGFSKPKELMLHMVIDEENNDPKRIIPIGEKLFNATGERGVARVQVRLLMQDGQQEEADKLNRLLCVLEYQRTGKCEYVLQKILEMDSADEMGYAKRLTDWHTEWLKGRDTELAKRVRAVSGLDSQK